MKKSILFFIFDMGNGGAEKVLTSLVTFLDPEKYDITVQTLFDYGVNRKFLPKHVKYRTFFHHRRFPAVTYVLRMFSPEFLFKTIIRRKYDVMIAYLENITTRIMSGCPREGVRKIAWVHNQRINPIPYRSDEEQRRAYESFDKVVFVSEYARQAFKKNFPTYNIDTAVVYNTLDIDMIKRLANEEIDIKLDKNIINLFSVGRLIENKGYVRLMDILGRLKNDGVDGWHFYLLGEGVQRPEIEAKINQYGLENNVTLLGFEVNPHKYVSRMDLFVCSSLVEGYSTAVTESVIHGVPVLTTECSGMSEIFGESGCGIIVDNNTEALYDALKKLLLAPRKIQEMRQNAINRSGFFSREATLKQFEQVVEGE
ncbi:MAG: glycosyltransferase [Muribaculaceae bacterium]|nr:glycosyltransferase [Muribaculaceae bacterium]